MKTLVDMATSLYNYKEYPRFLQHRKRRVFGFGVLLVTFYFLLTIIVPIVRFQINTGGINKLLSENIPDFELSDGILWAEDVFEYEDGGTLFLIDTTNTDIDEESLFRKYSDVYLLDAEKMAFKSNGETGVIRYSEMDFEIDREGAIELINNFAVIVVVFGCIVIYFWMWGTFFLGVLILTLAAMIISACTKTKLTFGQIYILAVYSRTLPLLIKGIVSLLPITVPFFWMFNFGLSLGILAFVFSRIKADLQQMPQQTAFENQYNI